MSHTEKKDRINNHTKNTSNQLGNYGDGFQVVLGDESSNNNFNIQNMSSEVAMTAIEEAGIFAETSAAMNEAMHANNLQFADNTIKDTFNFAAESNKNTFQFADNAINDAFGLAMRTSQNSAQLADNAIQSNDSMLGKSMVFLTNSLNEAQETISNVVSTGQAQSRQLADSMLSVGESVTTGSTKSQKLVMNIVTVGAVGGLILILAKSVKK